MSTDGLDQILVVRHEFSAATEDLRWGHGWKGAGLMEYGWGWMFSERTYSSPSTIIPASDFPDVAKFQLLRHYFFVFFLTRCKMRTLRIPLRNLGKFVLSFD